MMDMRDEDFGSVRMKLEEVIQWSGLSKNKVAQFFQTQRRQLNHCCKMFNVLIWPFYPVFVMHGATREWIFWICFAGKERIIWQACCGMMKSLHDRLVFVFRETIVLKEGNGHFIKNVLSRYFQKPTPVETIKKGIDFLLHIRCQTERRPQNVQRRSRGARRIP